MRASRPTVCLNSNRKLREEEALWGGESTKWVALVVRRRRRRLSWVRNKVNELNDQINSFHEKRFTTCLLVHASTWELSGYCMFHQWNGLEKNRPQRCRGTLSTGWMQFYTHQMQFMLFRNNLLWLIWNLSSWVCVLSQWTLWQHI